MENKELIAKIEELYYKDIKIEDKASLVMDFCPNLVRQGYYGNLKSIFSNPLPIVKGVQITTTQIGVKSQYIQKMITQMPDKEALSDEVQMAWMYVLGGNAAFELEPWFISTSAANLKEGQKNLWEKYKKKLSDVKVGEYNILLQEYGDKAGYRVYLTECEMTVQEPNDTREWNEVTGIILGEFKRG